MTYCIETKSGNKRPAKYRSYYTLNLHIVYLLPLAGPNNELIVAFCKRHNCCVQVSPVNVYCPSAHIMHPLNVLSMVDLQIRG